MLGIKKPFRLKKKKKERKKIVEKDRERVAAVGSGTRRRGSHSMPSPHKRPGKCKSACTERAAGLQAQLEITRRILT